MDHLRFVQSVDGLGQGVVVAVTPAADRRLDTGLCKPLHLADGDILRSSVGVMNQLIGSRRLTGVQSLLQGIQHEVCGHGRADAPAHDTLGEHVDHKGHVQPALLLIAILLLFLLLSLKSTSYRSASCA